MMRTATLILLVGVTMMLLGCGPFDGGQEAQEVGTAPVELERLLHRCPPREGRHPL